MTVTPAVLLALPLLLSPQLVSGFISPGDKSALVDFFLATHQQTMSSVDGTTTQQLWKDHSGWHLDRSISCVDCDPCNMGTRWKGVGCHDPCDPYRDGPNTVTKKAFDDSKGHEHIRHTSTLRWSETLDQFMRARPVCDKGRVTSLVLADNNLYGTIPVSFGHMRNLTYVDLSNNRLMGSIPAEIADIRNIEHLLLQHNDLTGTIPASLGSISAAGGNALLRVVAQETDGDGNVIKSWHKRGGIGNEDDVDDSPFSEIWGISELNLGFNLLTGTIPTELGLLDTLNYLDLSNNRLSGSIPEDIPRGCPMLQVLYLHENQLTGSIPHNIGAAHPAYHTNGITGTAESHPLRYVYAYNNRLRGSIPSSMGSLAFLSELKLYNNSILGTIPSEICKMSNLRFLALQDNDLTGKLPDCLGDFNYLQYLDLYNNFLTGDMPATLSNAPALKYLYLQNEHLLPLRQSFCGRRIPMFSIQDCKNDPCDSPPCKHDVLVEGRLTSDWDDLGQLSDESFATSGNIQCSRKKYNWIQVKMHYKSMMAGSCATLHSTEYTFNELPEGT